MGPPKAFQRLDGLNYVAGGCGRLRPVSRASGSILDQAGGIRINANAPRGGLPSEFRVKLRCELNRYRHSGALKALP
jgi:hypothetical protein